MAFLLLTLVLLAIFGDRTGTNGQSCDIVQDAPFNSNDTAVSEVRELIGAYVMLHCDCDNSNMGELWYFNNTSINNTQGGILNISLSSTASGGVYTCYNSTKVESVTVTISPINVTISPSTPAALTYGGSFLLNCILGLQPLSGTATYMWQNNGTVLPNQNASTLSIPMVTTSHRGTYTCSVQLHGVTLSSPSGVLLSVIVPQPTVSPINPVAIGTNATLSCSVSLSSGSVSYQWTKNSAALSDGGSISGSAQSILSITNVGIVDQGAYRCGVSVGGVSNTSSPVNLTTTGPYLLQSLGTSVNVTVNSNLSLVCVANASSPSPPLTATWYTPSTASGVTVGGSISGGVVTSTLIITGVNVSSGGVYTCGFTSRLPEDGVNSSTTVYILIPAQIVGFPGDNGVMATANTAATLPYTIKCSVISGTQPIPTLTLQRALSDGTAVVLNTTTSTTITFTLQSPLLTDTGVYVCTASNSLGNDSRQLILTVQDKPDPVNLSSITSTPISLNYIQITWAAPNSNNAPITSYTVTYCPADPKEHLCPFGTTETGAAVHNLTADLIPLNANRVYRVTLVANNSVGASNNVTYFVNSSTSGDAAPINLTAIYVSNYDVIVTWLLPPLSVFTNYYSFPVTLTNFILYYNRIGSTSGESQVIPFSLSKYQGNPLLNATANLTGITPNDQYSLNISLISTYSAPSLNSSAAMITVNIATTTLGTPAPPTVNRVSNMVTFSWDALVPLAQRPFISQYTLQYSISSLYTAGLGRRRQASPASTTFSVPTTTTSAQVPRVPYSLYSYQVSAAFPGFTAPITAISSFSTADYQTAASAPQGLMVTGFGTYSSIPIQWSVPALPNGNIASYVVTVNSTPSASYQVNSNVYTYTVGGLRGYTPYLISVTAMNGAGPGNSSTITATTPSSVCPPTLVLPSSVGTSFEYSISTSDLCGPISFYRVVVSKTSSIPTAQTSGSYWSQAQFDTNGYYVLYDDASSVGNTTIPLSFSQTATSRTYKGATYSVVAPVTPGTYYLVVFLYSGVNQNMVIASVSVSFTIPVVEVANNTVAIVVGVVASVAVILLLVFLVLLFMAIFLRRPKVRQSHELAHTNGDGGKAHGGEVELKRRTKILSPNLSVGSSDVFTSAGQPTTLVCEVSGTPPPEVTWERAGEKERGQQGESAQLLEKQAELPLDKQRFVKLSDHSLFITDTDLQDEGVYIVKATNPGGTAEATVKVTVARPVPPEPDCEHPSIPVDSFTERIAMLRNDNGAGLEDEYADVELEWNFTSYAANLNVNKIKNRYVNIIPYDHSRVVLPLQDNTPGSDYINSSYIDGFKKQNCYIATQGPMPSTFADFWRMVWEFDCPTIVMVTNLQEEDKVKCHQYWPSYGSTTYGHLKVTLKEVENLAEYSIRTFSVTPISGQSRSPMPIREVRQFHFLVWPDHGVPQYATALLSFRKRVTKYHPLNRGPMVVHCSAGVGRTGTFICIDYVLKQIEGEAIVDIFNFVRHMRYRRNYMVQTSAQYIFIHDAILESVMCGDTSIAASELKDRMATMREIDPESQRMKIEVQFETLNSASPMDKDFDCSIAEVPDNQKKNRFNVHLPSNNFRVTLSGDKNQSDYICASFLDGYRQRSAFIITQAPMKDTVGDFWRMIWEHKSAAIVMLAQLVEDGKEVCVRYWPEEMGRAEVFGKYQVEKSTEDRTEGTYVIRKFKICSLDNPQDNRMITQFHYLMWPNRAAPENTKSIVELIDELQRVQRKSGNGPITVHCHDGIGRTGTFCAAYSMMDRVKVEQVVDAFQTIKSMRIQRAGLLDSLAQYIFLHSALLEFLSTFDAYQNFK